MADASKLLVCMDEGLCEYDLESGERYTENNGEKTDQVDINTGEVMVINNQ